MIENLRQGGHPSQKSDVYICNVVKCGRLKTAHREPDEDGDLRPVLYRQLSAIRPKADLCTRRYGAAKGLLARKEGSPECAVTGLNGIIYLS